MSAISKTIYVYDSFSNVEPQLMGRLYVDLIRGRESYSFEYDYEWLSSANLRVSLDPELGTFSGRQYPSGKNIFGLFADSSPDRWGRVLMNKRERIKADKESRKPAKLFDSDYLLGVYDETRMGGIRFKVDTEGAFLSDDEDSAVPPWAYLRTLEEASRHFENEDSGLTDKWLNQLIRPGSSLGGARPKATVIDQEGNLWIAKFPSQRDKKNTGAWEAVTMNLAKQCHIQVAPFEAKTLNNAHATFLTRRFDRDGQGRRIHFSSAMTMLGYTDGDTDGCSYLELFEWIGRNCCRVEDNLAELWRRIVFSIAVSNCDDHLRNHGFLLTPQGWTLSPAYDLNPQEYGDGLSLNINEHDNALDFALALEVAPYAGISKANASQMIEQTKEAVARWRTWATLYHIPREEQEMMAKAFEH